MMMPAMIAIENTVTPATIAMTNPATPSPFFSSDSFLGTAVGGIDAWARELDPAMARY